jgi:hypothetical protein
MVHGGLEEDLLEALKELLISSEALASGETPTVEECNGRVARDGQPSLATRPYFGAKLATIRCQLAVGGGEGPN